MTIDTSLSFAALLFSLIWCIATANETNVAQNDQFNTTNTQPALNVTTATTNASITAGWIVTTPESTPDARLASCCEENGVNEACRNRLCKSYDKGVNFDNIFWAVAGKHCNESVDVDTIFTCMSKGHDHRECCKKNGYNVKTGSKDMTKMCQDAFCAPVTSLWDLLGIAEKGAMAALAYRRCMSKRNAKPLIKCYKEYDRQLANPYATTQVPYTSDSDAKPNAITPVPSTSDSGAKLEPRLKGGPTSKASGGVAWSTVVWIAGGTVIFYICATMAGLTVYVIIETKRERRQQKKAEPKIKSMEN